MVSGIKVNTLISVTEDRARLLLRCSQVNHIGITKQLGQLSLPSLRDRLIEYHAACLAGQVRGGARSLVSDGR